jgi:benzoate/toluate 1,2-dioxygenase subunit alpha
MGLPRHEEHLMTAAKVNLMDSVSSALIDDIARGDHRLNREIYTDEALFELEMQLIFEANWVFVAHESQIPEPHDFFTTYIGRQPVVLSRTASGELSCFLNSCAHRGAMVVRKKTGNRKTHTCGFHGWTYDCSGSLKGITDQERGAYPDTLDEGKLGLKNIRVESYRGFVFASINPDVLPLKDYLNGASIFVDLIVDSSLSGEMEVLQGTGIYTYKGNWKLSTENGIDGYHGPMVHGSYIDLTLRRMRGLSNTNVQVSDLSRLSEIPGGFYAFENGHSLLWTDYVNWKVRPSAVNYDHYVEKFGLAKADWMVKKIRNTLLAPNAFLMDSMSQQIRVIRPISVNKTEVTIYALAPVGESAAVRESRIRQYEDFYNASGLATPDDVTEFTQCQKGFAARGMRWSDISRGATKWSQAQDETARSLGFTAALSGGDEPGTEGIYIAMYRDWIKRLTRKIDRAGES